MELYEKDAYAEVISSGYPDTRRRCDSAAITEPPYFKPLLLETRLSLCLQFAPATADWLPPDFTSSRSGWRAVIASQSFVAVICILRGGGTGNPGKCQLMAPVSSQESCAARDSNPIAPNACQRFSSRIGQPPKGFDHRAPPAIGCRPRGPSSIASTADILPPSTGNRRSVRT